MPERKVSFRLTPETTKLFEEYLKKWNVLDEVKLSQIFRAGLEIMMVLPEAVSDEKMDKLGQKIEQKKAEMRDRFKKHPDPRLYELYEELMATEEQMIALLEKTAEKYSSVVGEGKKGKKQPPYKKHTPGKYPDSVKGFEKAD